MLGIHKKAAILELKRAYDEVDAVGVIGGFEDGDVYLTHNGDTKNVELSMIRNVITVMAKKIV